MERKVKPRDAEKILLVQVSPYPPEPGSDYHYYLARAARLSNHLPVVVLAGLNHLDSERAEKAYGLLENNDGVIVYRAFWAPRLLEEKNPWKALRFLASSLRALSQVTSIARRKGRRPLVHFHYGPTSWPGLLLGEHFPLGMALARLEGARVVWVVHSLPVVSQVLREARQKGLPLLLALLGAIYHTIIVLFSALWAHRVVVLVDNPGAGIKEYLERLVPSRGKVVEYTHPVFWSPAGSSKAPGAGREVLLVCPGYIRAEKGYHVLLHWLARLKDEKPEVYRRIRVIIAGGIDRNKREDIEYLRALLELRRQHGLGNVSIVVRKLGRKEFYELLRRSNIVWAAYTKKYGPSGILAWARTFGKKAIMIDTLWGPVGDGKPGTPEENVVFLLSIVGFSSEKNTGHGEPGTRKDDAQAYE